MSSQTSPQILPGEHLHALRSRLRGDVHLPGDAGWDAARRAWLLLVDQRPAAVVIPADTDDVVAAVLAARRLGLRIAPQATGHGAGTVEALADSILLRTTRLDTVEIDPVNRRARVGAGAGLAAVAAAAGEHGLAVVSGMAPTVGVTGFTLGGGLGWLARSHGLATCSVVSLDAVDARGQRVHADASADPDLFWAARGGIAPVVVTALELQLYPMDRIWAGGLLWPLERAADVAHAWREWVAGVPETVTSLARVLRYPPIPEIPEFLRGRSFVSIELAIQGDADEADALLAPLRHLAPEIDTVRSMPPAELGTVHGDPVDPVPAFGAAIVLSELSPEAVDAVLDAALAPPSAALLSIEVRHLGGMLAPGRAPEAGAVSAIDGAGLVYAVGIVPAPEALVPVQTAAALVLDRLRPYASGAVVKNFTETPAPATALYGDAVDRLREVVAAWDPEEMIMSGHPLG